MAGDFIIVYSLVNIESSPEECNATDDDSSINAWLKKINQWLSVYKSMLLLKKVCTLSFKI
ncbi:hypothetical protein BH10BAC2_BH10BAC2_00400 [soil metagenome]